jgi:hypothetical protein
VPELDGQELDSRQELDRQEFDAGRIVGRSWIVGWTKKLT